MHAFISPPPSLVWKPCLDIFPSRPGSINPQIRRCCASDLNKVCIQHAIFSTSGLYRLAQYASSLVRQSQEELIYACRYKCMYTGSYNINRLSLKNKSIIRHAYNKRGYNSAYCRLITLSYLIT